MKTIKILLAATLFLAAPDFSFSQNIAINTSGAVAASTNMLEVTQTSTAANMVAIYAINSGATAGTGYGLYSLKSGAATVNVAGYFEATGGTANYPGIFMGGNVGIGTVSPARRLDIQQASDAVTSGIGIINTAVSSRLNLWCNGTAGEIDAGGTGANNLLLNAAGGAGKVGIGTTNPLAKLHVEAATAFFRNTGVNSSGVDIYGGTDGASSSTIYMKNPAGTISTFLSDGTYSSFLNYTGGNVGIGTNVPQTTLDVAASGQIWIRQGAGGGLPVAAGTGFKLESNASGGSLQAFDYAGGVAKNIILGASGGNVGIATVSPVRTLHVNGTFEAGNSDDNMVLLNVQAQNSLKSGIAIGYNQTYNGVAMTNAGFLQAETQGTGYRSILINPLAGNVGIGTTAPVAHLEVIDATSGANSLTVSKNFNGIGNTNTAFIGGTDASYGNTGIYVNQKDNLGLNTATSYIFNVVNNAVSSFVVNGLDNIGIGTVTPAEKVTIHPAANINVGITSLTGTPTILAHNDAWNAWLDLSINNSLIVKAAGNVGIGNTNPGYKLHVTGDIYASGQMYCFGVGICSDLRFKKDIEPIGGSLDKILKLNGVYYNWDQKLFPEKNFPDERQVGFIAQNVEQYFPELVLKDKEGYRAVDYARLTPVLVEAMKEQQKIIEQLQNDKATSDARIEKLEAMVRLLAETAKK